MSLAPQAEECQQTQVQDFAQEEGAIERDFIINCLLALFYLRRK